MKKIATITGIFTLIITGIMLGYSPHLVAQPAASPWPVFGHDAQHSGSSPYLGPIEPVSFKWSLAVPKSVSSSVMAPDGTLYMGTANGLYAINSDGTLKWTFVGELAQINSTPAIGDDGTIYVGIGGFLYAVAPDGTEKWRQATGWHVISPTTIAANGIIYVGDRDGHVYAIDPHAADPADRLVWQSDYIGSVEYNAPALSQDGETVYITSRSPDDASVGALAALDVEDGELLWQVTTPGGISIMSSPLVGTDGTVYFGSRNTYLYAINPDGTEQWRYKTGGGIDATPSLGDDGTVYVGSMDGYLYAINPDGTQKWRYATVGDVRAMATIGSDGTLYFGDSSGRVYAVDMDGIEQWNVSLAGGDILESPIIGRDGTLYVGTYFYAGRFYAIQGQNPPEEPASPWPMYGHDTRNTGLSAYQGPAATQYTKWSFAVAKSVSTSVMGPDGTIYMGTHNGLYAVNPDGTIKWTFVGVLAQVNSTPAVDSDGTIYVGIGGYLYAIAPDGTERWKQATGWHIISPPTIAMDGMIYVGDRDGHVYAIDPHAADPADRLVWKSAYIGSVEYNAPAISLDGGTVYITSRNPNDATMGALAALDADTGSLDWQVVTPGGISIMSSPVVGTDGTIYFGSRNTYVYAMNPDGTEKWKFKTSGGIDATASLGGDGTIYIGSMDNHLYALNPDGTEKWRFATLGDIRAMAAIGSTGTLYFGDSRGRLYSVNADGSENWRTYLSGGEILDTPIIGEDDTLYVGTYFYYGRFYAFGLTEPDPYFGQCIFLYPETPHHYIDDYDEGMEWGTDNTYFNVVWNGHLILELISISRLDTYNRPYWETGGYRYTRGAFITYEAEWGVNDWEVCKTTAGTLAPAP